MHLLRDRLAGALLALALGCGHQPPAAPSPPLPRAVPLGPAGCQQVIEGQILSRSGALWFDAGRPAPAGDGAQAAEAGAGPARWGADVVLLGNFPGRYSTLLPIGEPLRLFTVRAAAVAKDRAGDALVQIDPARLTQRPVWSDGGRLRLLGLSSARAVLLVEDVQGARVAAVDPTGGVVRSDPLELAPDLPAGPRPELGLPHAAPLGPDRWVVRCAGGLCLVQLRLAEGRIEVQHLPLQIDALGLWRGELLLRKGRRCLGTRGRPPERWARQTGRPCPREADFSPEEPGLPVDGVLTAGARVPVAACLVRSEVELPPLRDPPARRPAAAPAPPQEGGAGVVLLPLPDEVPQDLSVDLLARGRALSVGFAAQDGPGQAAPRRDFGLALQPGTVSVERVEVAGRAMYHVRIRAPVPFDPSPSCWRGHLVIRVTHAAGEAPDQVHANRDWEFGQCE